MATTWTKEVITDAGTATSTSTPSTAWQKELLDLNIAASTLSLSSGSLTLSNSLLEVDTGFTIRTTDNKPLTVNSNQTLYLKGRMAVAQYANSVIETITSAGQFRVYNNLVVDDNATIGGNLEVTGTSDFDDDMTTNDISCNGNVTIAGTLEVQGLITGIGNLSCAALTTSSTINCGATVTALSVISASMSTSGNMTLDSGGDIELNADGGDIVFKDDATTLATISSGATKFSVGNNFTWDNANFTITSPHTTTWQPLVKLRNEGTTFTEAGQLMFERTDCNDNDVLGAVNFQGVNDEGGNVTYTTFWGGVIEDDATSDDERGYYTLQVKGAGTNSGRNGLMVTGGTNQNSYFTLGAGTGELYTDDSGNCTFDMDGETRIGKESIQEGRLALMRKDSNEFPYIKMYSSDNTPSYLFVANNGTLRIHSSIPTADSDGSAV
tara:strand:+ start:5364 stop:6680 length:1317 start_codon:yes stop_codon:yes gene_type:complete